MWMDGSGVEFSEEAFKLMCQTYTVEMVRYLQEKICFLGSTEEKFINFPHDSLPDGKVTLEMKQTISKKVGLVSVEDIRVTWQNSHAQIEFSGVKCELYSDLTYANFTFN